MCRSGMLGNTLIPLTIHGDENKNAVYHNEYFMMLHLCKYIIL